MAPLMLGVFGAFQVTLADGSTAKFESDKTCALLAYLAVEADRPHRRDALVGSSGLMNPNRPRATICVKRSLVSAKQLATRPRSRLTLTSPAMKSSSIPRAIIYSTLHSSARTLPLARATPIRVWTRALSARRAYSKPLTFIAANSCTSFSGGQREFEEWR